MVKINPSLLQFKPPFTQGSTEYIQITNDSQETIAFKVKTTAPKLYCVRPNAASISPGEVQDVQVIFLGLKHEPEPHYKCNDKFLIVTLPCPYPLSKGSVAESWKSLEDQYKSSSVSRKIKVSFVQQAPEASEQVSEKVLEPVIQPEPKPVENPVISATPPAASQKEDLSVEDRNIIEDLNEKLDSNASRSSTSSKSAATAKKPTTVQTQTPIPLRTVIMFALIAFIIGWLFF